MTEQVMSVRQERHSGPWWTRTSFTWLNRLHQWDRRGIPIAGEHVQHLHDWTGYANEVGEVFLLLVNMYIILHDWTGYANEVGEWTCLYDRTGYANEVGEWTCLYDQTGYANEVGEWTCLYDWTGYANEVGEAFRALVNVRLVWASYGVASCYVVADATHKAWRAYSQVMQFVSAEMESFTFHFEALMIFFAWDA